MEGLLRLNTNEIVGKKSKYKTKEEFVKAIKEEGREVDMSRVGETFMRYYPKGTEDSRHEFGKGEGVYMCTDIKGRGTFEVWIV